ncbi:MAG: flagellar protein FliS [Candidatus Zixiibacteriota bacterium]|nr:MAG: flagellar protein FliS [candidate division Zixibacteria bacterium]
MSDEMNAYQKTAILGKSQVELVIKVYDGAIAAFKEGVEAYREGDNGRGYERLEKAKRFVTHLYTTLDEEKGGEIAKRLSRLYAFVINQSNVAQATKDLNQIDDNISILENLRLGWVGLKEQQEREKEAAADGSQGESQRTVITSA